MAINDPNYRYAVHTFEADGVETDWEISFDGGYIRQSDVVAFSVLVDPDTGLTTGRTIHALTFLNEVVGEDTLIDSATVRITPAVADGRRLVIFRSTEKAKPLVNYQDDSMLTKKNLDLANKQAIFGLAEVMDGLNAAQISIDSQVQEIIDMNELIRNIYESVLELLASGGIISVNPRVFSGVGTGDTPEFPMVGADVDGAGFYDVYVAGVGKEPGVDYNVIIGATPADTTIVFSAIVPDGVRWFAVLRGYAKPYTGPTPITSLDLNVVENDTGLHFTTYADRWALIRCTNPAGCLVTVQEINPILVNRLRKGSYASFMQCSAGAVSIDHDPDVTLHIPPGCLPATRGMNSVISITCEDDDANLWVLSGDLAKE